MRNFKNLLIVSCLVFGLSGVLSANIGGSDLNELESTLQGVPGVDDILKAQGGQAQDAMKAACDKNGGPDAFFKVGNATEKMKTCIQGLANITEVQSEVEEAKKTGSLEVVFGKYCGKMPEFDKCVNDYLSVLELCLDAKQKLGKIIAMNVTKSLSEFVCHKRGERIAMFIAEGGVECLQSKQEEIQRCVNQTMGDKIEKTNKTLMDAGVSGVSDLNQDSFSFLKFDTRECTDYKKVQDCIVEELKHCSDPSPSNIVESLFKYILKMTPCQSLLKPTTVKDTKSGASYNLLSGGSILTAIVLSSISQRLFV